MCVSLVLILFPPLVQDGPARQARELLEKLRSDDLEVRVEASRKLKALGQAVLPDLEKLGRDPDADVAARAKRLHRAITYLGKLSPSFIKALPGVEDRLAGEDPHAWTEVLIEVADKYDEKGYPVAKKRELELLAPKAARGARTVQEKRNVCLAMSNRHFATGAAEMERFLQDEDGQVRAWAATALGNLHARAAIPKLLKLLRDEDKGVPGSVAVALGFMGVEEAIPELLKLLKAPDAYTRGSAATALGYMRAREAAAEVMKLLNDREVRVMAARALGEMGATEAVPAICELLKEEDEGVRAWAAMGLAEISSGEAIPKLLPLLADKSFQVRQWAVGALGNLPAKERVPEIAKRLGDEHFIVRAFAATALGNLGAREAVPELLKRLSDKDYYITQCSIDAVGMLGAREAIPELIKLLENEYVRKNAIEALARLEASEAAAPVESLLVDDAEEVRVSAASFLCERGSRRGVPVLLECSDSLVALNALRRPGSLKRLRTGKATGEGEGRAKVLTERLAKEAGLSVEWPPPSPVLQSWMDQRRRLPHRENRPTLLEALQLLVWGEYEAVVEGDRLRILPRDEASTYWQAWWQEEHKRK